MTQKRKRNILRASIISALGTIFSRVLGALRDIAIANQFGASGATDAFWVAWTVPSVFRRFVADEGLTGALIPAVSQTEAADGIQRAKQLAGSVLLVLLLACAILVAGGYIGAPWLVQAFAHGFSDDPEKFALTVELTQWLFPFVAFVSLVSFCEALLNYRNHFFIPKVAPGLVSAAIAIFALFVAPSLERPIFALAMGVLVGGVAHVLICVPPLIARWGLQLPSTAGFGMPRFRFFLGEMGKVIAIGLIAQVNVVMLRLLATFLEEGSVTQYWYANRVVDLAQGAIAVAVSSALLPAIAEDAANEDWDQFREHFHEATMLAAIVLIPAAAFLLAMGLPIVSVLFRHGAFDYSSAVIASQTLYTLVPFMLALAGMNIVKKVYFALDDRTTLLIVGLLGLSLTGGLGYLLSNRFGVVGLGLALSISGAIQLAAYLLFLRSKMGEKVGLLSLVSPLGRLALAAAPAGGLAFWLCRFGDWEAGPASLTNWLLLAAAGMVGLVIYGSIGWALRVEQLQTLIRRVRRMIPG